MIIAEGHVKMTLRFSICSKYAVTLEAIKTGNFLRTLRVSGSARGGLKMKRKKKNQGDHSTHAVQVGSAASFLEKAWEKPGKKRGQGLAWFLSEQRWS